MFITVSVGQVFALKEAAQAHRSLEGRATAGASVLLPQALEVEGGFQLVAPKAASTESVLDHATIGLNDLAMHPRCLVGGQEADDIRHLLGPADPVERTHGRGAVDGLLVLS